MATQGVDWIADCQRNLTQLWPLELYPGATNEHIVLAKYNRAETDTSHPPRMGLCS